MNKKDVFPEADNRIADYAKALSHPARLTILKAVAEKGTCICGELVLALPLAQSTVSQHLKELRNAGLITGSVDGPRSCYCVNREAITALEKAIGSFCAGLRNAECC